MWFGQSVQSSGRVIASFRSRQKNSLSFHEIGSKKVHDTHMQAEG
jgi:hypothetical protein